MKDFNFQLAGDTGIHFYPKNEDNKYIELLLNEIKKKPPNGIIDLIPSLVNLLVVFDPKTTSSLDLIDYVNQLKLSNTKIIYSNPSHWEIPICYESKYGLDLNFISDQCEVSPEDIVSLHQNKIYKVSMMGFLPGLPFLTELDPKLKLPRKSNPRTLVPSGSIGIAINQSVIYPQDSPGGWNLVGRTPINLFDQRRENAILLSIGDKITFNKIDGEEFDDIFNKNLNSPFKINKIEL